MSSSLSPESVLGAYMQGAFPMADPDSGELQLFSCDPRCILPLEEGGMHTPSSLRRVIRSGRFRLTSDTCFDRVIDSCATDRSRDNRSWISPELKQIYSSLHRAGFAHSIEAWNDEALVGGLYGVALGGAFFGESMFSLPQQGGRDASKVCLVALVERLRALGFVLLDCQYANAHMLSMGAIEIPACDYIARLEVALEVKPQRWRD